MSTPSVAGLAPPSSTTRIALPPIAELQDLTDIVLIHKLLNDATQLEALLQQDLEQVMTKSDKVEAKLEYLDVIPTKLKPIIKEGKDLTGQISKTCGIADNVSRKVRDLDYIRERVKKTTKKVEDIVDVKNCIDGVNKALASEDYEKAASFIARYLTIGSACEGLLDDALVQSLQAAKLRLEQLVDARLNAAVAANTNAEIVRFCRLYVPLGRSDEGRRRYVAHVARAFAQNITTAFSTAPEPLRELASVTVPGVSAPAAAQSPSKPLFATPAAAPSAQQPVKLASYAQYLRAILESFVKTYEKHAAEVDRSFGAGTSGPLLRELASVVELFAMRLIDVFVERHSISKISDAVAAHKRSTSSRSSPPDVDVRMLADYLELMCAFSSLAHAHALYCSTKLTALNTANHASSNNVVAANVNNANSNADLARRNQVLLAQYIELEEFYMVQSTHKAIAMDSQQEGTKVSSLVDNVFFVLHKACMRATASCSANTLCAILMIVNNCLNMDFREFLQNLLRERATQHKNHTYMSVLNNLEASGDYITKLRDEVEHEAERMFASAEEREREKVRVLLADVGETARSFKKLLQSNLEQVGTTITPLLRSLVEIFQSVSYELNESEFQSLELGAAGEAGGWLEKFCAQLDGILQPFRDNLTPSNFDQLLQLVIRDIAIRLEKALLAKRFNQLGGLQLDKDIRKLIAHFSASSQLSVRSEFARLSQFAILLNLEKITEVYDYYNSGNMNWRLTPAEVRKTLARRVDFSPAEVASVKL